ncbi:MAG: radical SAM protein, partial [Duodenibacillus sp.]|nr:radical SAM protein [Duodenibacillus sp.]
DDTVAEILEALSERYVQGLSVLGGDPLEPENEPEVARLLAAVRERFGDSKDIWLWTGRKHERVKDSPALAYVDVLVDGPFHEKERIDAKRAWRGSANQRVIRLRQPQAGPA